jgi:folylpolyglutamate synthase/dihydrofolate synthase
MSAPRVDPAAVELAPFLDQLVDFERLRPKARAWDLGNMRELLSAAAGLVPTRSARQRCVQVGGSKGKGTTAAMMAGLARTAGLRVGVYSSPHLESMCERIEVDGERITVAELRGGFAAVVGYGRRRGLELTFFEVMTVVAARHFAERDVDLAIYEVGLGGRHDATTALPVDASIVTAIELEHTEVLGDTVEAIAAEKAPVIRPAGLGLTAAAGSSLRVIEQHAERVGARLAVYGREFSIVGEQRADGSYTGHLVCGKERIPLRLPDARRHELPALGLAWYALRELFGQRDLVLDPVSRVCLPGRFEVLVGADGMPVVLDVAHTEGSMATVAAELRDRFPGQRVALLFAAAAGKRWREGLGQLLDLVDSVVVTELTGTVGEDPTRIADWLRQRGVECMVLRDAEEAFSELCRRPMLRIVLGSFYLVGRVRSLAHPDLRA